MSSNWTGCNVEHHIVDLTSTTVLEVRFGMRSRLRKVCRTQRTSEDWIFTIMV